MPIRLTARALSGRPSSANEPITLAHADKGKADDTADDGKKSAEGSKKEEDSEDGDTVEDVINSLTEKQKTVAAALFANTTYSGSPQGGICSPINKARWNSPTSLILR